MVFAAGCFPDDQLHVDKLDATTDVRADLGADDSAVIDVRTTDVPTMDVVVDAGSPADTGPADAGTMTDAGPIIDGSACALAPPMATTAPVFDGLTNPRDFVFDGRGGVLVAQGNTVQRRANGVLSTLTTIGAGEIVALRYTRTFGLVMAVVTATDAGTSSGAIYQLVPGASIPSLRQGGLRRPAGIAVDANDGVWFSDTAANTVYWMPGDPSGGVSARAVVTDIPSPTQLLVDAAGRYLYAARSDTNTVMRVEVSTGDAGTPGSASEFVGGFSRVSGLAQDTCGNIFIADELVNRVWRVPLDTSIAASRVVTDVNGPRSIMFGVGAPYGPREIYSLSSMDGTLRGANLVALGSTLPVPTP